MCLPMKFTRLSRALSLGLALSGISLAAAPKTDLSRYTPVPADQQIPISDFFREGIIHSASINDAGTKLAAVVTDNQDRRLLMVHDLTNKKTEFMGGPNQKDIAWFRWQDDNNLSFSLVKEKWYGYGLFSVSANDLKDSYPLLQYCGIQYLGSTREQPRNPLIWLSFDGMSDGATHDRGVFRINARLNAGPAVDLEKGNNGYLFADVRDNNEKHLTDAFPQLPDQALGYSTDSKGNLQLAYTIKDAVRSVHLFKDNKWERCAIDLEKVDIISSGNEHGQLVAYARGEERKPGPVLMIDALTGNKISKLYQDDTYDFNGWVRHDPQSREVIGLTMERGYPTNLWFTESYKALQKQLNAMFPKQYVSIQSTSLDQSVMVVSTMSDRNPISYHWVDMKNGAAGPIKNSRPWIDPSRMSPMSLVKFTTRDGYKLDAYLTIPNGTTKDKPAPLVVLCHGGPWSRDSWGFNEEVQFLASRGYAVLQPNYRGSTGYDSLFTVADRWDFKKMQYDVSDATKSTVANPLIDADRVAIMGWSFGGYHAIAGAEEQPCPYRCAVALAGVYDWEVMMKSVKKGDKEQNMSRYDYMVRFMGTPDKNPEKYAEISPINYVDRIRIPVFVGHGKIDQTVKASQSKDLVARLRENKVPVEFMLMNDEGHGSRNIDTTVELYSRIEAFLSKNLAPRVKTSGN